MAKKIDSNSSSKNSSVKLKKLQVPDTNVLINDPLCLDIFIGDENKAVVPLTVIKELDKKKNDPNIGYDAREAIRQINKYAYGQSDFFSVESKMNFEGLPLDKNVPDEKILATFNYIINADEYKDFDKYVLISNDSAVRIMAHSLFGDNEKVSIEIYKRERVEQKNSRADIPVVVFEKDYVLPMETPYVEDKFGVINHNGGIILNYKEEGVEKERLFIRKGDRLELIKNDYTLNGLKPMKLMIPGPDGVDIEDPRPNFGQLLLFKQVMDPSIQIVFAEGVAGSGKTLIALAGGLFQRSLYKKIIIVPSMVRVANEDNMGFLPGTAEDKSAPWLLPIEQNLDELEHIISEKMKGVVSQKTPNKKPNGFSQNNEEFLLRDKYGITVQQIDYIRGQSICDAYIIIEEAQNFTMHKIKSIITRAGRGTKIVFTGDLSQIDNFRYLDVNSSGFTGAIEKMVGREQNKSIAATVMLKSTVRSPLAKLASEVL